MSKIYVGATPISKVLIGGKKYVAKVEKPADPNLVYSLGETSFDGSSYIDTGVNLSHYTSYTVCVDAKFGDTTPIQNLVDWMTEASPFPVWAIDLNGARIRMGVLSAFTIEGSPSVERRRYVVRCDSGTYTLFSIKDANGYDFTSTVASGTVNHTLIVGAYYNNGTIARYMHAGSVIYDMQVYSKALSDDQCKKYYEMGVIS